MTNIVWSKDNCSFCNKAKSLLEAKNIPFEERKIGSGWTKEQLIEVVPNARTVPQIFINGEYVGGYTDLVDHFQ